MRISDPATWPLLGLFFLLLLAAYPHRKQ